ncbi:hypothetical protein AYI68_g2368 [Smittium mucronatum]|uniref:Arrestin-like N-terminal domain-containing protein n=1 Tax=Smittium mucronatum TaxID=133383 RepID=A0A1R0H2Z4_9FUNG|nr:hypothetical protein AYI68_g2368 [Smittium mucronatum]
MNMFSAGKIEIQLQNDTILFHGTEETTGSKLVYGNIQLILKSMKRIKSISLNLCGVIENGFQGGFRDVKGFDMADLIESKDMIINDKQILYQSDQKAGSIFLPGTYDYPFITKIRGDLPATVDTEFGKIEYTMKAVAEGGGIINPSISKNVPLYVRRIINLEKMLYTPAGRSFGNQNEFDPIDSGDSLRRSSTDSDSSSASTLNDTQNFCFETIPIQVNKTFGDRLQLRLDTNNSIYSVDQKFKFSVDFLPLSKSTKVISYGASLREMVLMPGCRGFGRREYLRTIGSTKQYKVTPNILARRRDCGKLASDTYHDIEVEITTPNKENHLDVDNRNFEISHFLEFYFYVDHNGNRERSTIHVPVYIVPQEYFSEINCLPLYSDVTTETPPPYVA